MLKIDENSLLNSIIKDGQIVIGQVGTDSCIYSSATSSIVHGYANNNSKIYTNEDTFGSYASGYTDEDSYINADGNGAHAEGYAKFGSYEYSKLDLTVSVGTNITAFLIISSVDDHNNIVITINYEFNTAQEATIYWNRYGDEVCHLLESIPNLSTEEKYNDYEYWFSCLTCIKNNIKYVNNKFLISILYKIKLKGINNLTTGKICIPAREMVYASINAIGDGAHAEGYAFNGSINAIGNGAHAEGYVYTNTINAIGNGAHAEGIATRALNEGTHAEGRYALAIGKFSHASGYATKANAEGSYAEGYNTESGHIEILSGRHAARNLSETAACIEFYDITSSQLLEIMKNSSLPYININDNKYSVTGTQGYPPGLMLMPKLSSGDLDTINNNLDGDIYLIGGDYSHAEGYETIASGLASHAEGYYVKSFGAYSHASGNYTIADLENQFVCGKYNTSNNVGSLFVVGNGNGGSSRSNAFWVNNDGTAHSKNGFHDESDIRKKDIISEISLEKSYELLEKSQEIIYTFKDDKERKEQLGMIALEVEEYFPEIVSTDSDGYKSLNYARLSVICLRLLKDINLKYKSLENDIKYLKNKIK